LQLPYRVTKRAHGVEYAIRDIMVKAEEVRRSGKRILPLNIGDPVKYDFDTPPHIKKALVKAVDSGANYYSPSEGMKELREAVAEKENLHNGARITPDNVLVT
jgi:alanine-synthesizing transaminase